MYSFLIYSKEIYFHLLFFKREKLASMFIEQRSPFLIPIEEMNFFSLLLFCAVLLVTVLFLFQKTAINNTLISKDCLCDFKL